MELRTPERRRLVTAIEDVADGVRFVVSGADPLAADRLAHMGYLALGDGRFATRWFSRSADIPRYAERFEASIEQMVLQSARLVRVPWQDALVEYLRRVDGSGLHWWLYGSAALAVRGLAIEPGDLDLHVDDAWRAGRLLDDLLITPVMPMDGWVARATGRAFACAIVEWLAGPLPEHDDELAPHEQGPFIAGDLETVSWRGHEIRVPPLSAQLRVCAQRGLTDRAALIRSAGGR